MILEWSGLGGKVKALGLDGEKGGGREVEPASRRNPFFSFDLRVKLKVICIA